MRGDAYEVIPHAGRGSAEGGDDRSAVGVVDERDTIRDDMVRDAAVVLAELVRRALRSS